MTEKKHPWSGPVKDKNTISLICSKLRKEITLLETRIESLEELVAEIDESVEKIVRKQGGPSVVKKG